MVKGGIYKPSYSMEMKFILGTQNKLVNHGTPRKKTNSKNTPRNILIPSFGSN